MPRPNESAQVSWSGNFVKKEETERERERERERK